MPGEHPAALLAEHIADDLADCRKRGIERLDVHTHNQVPVAAPSLRKLASEYAAANGLSRRGGTAQIKQLLRDALEAFRSQNQPDAELIRDLFFGEEVHTVTKTAGELLDAAQRKSGETNEVRFRKRRNAALMNFAEFLIGFVPDVHPPDPYRDAPPPALRGIADVDTGPAGAGGTESERRDALTGYVGDGQRFVHLLAEAVNVTIVGYTNETLSAMLEGALALKRAAQRRPDAFWASIRIVFLSDALLDFVNDERPESPDPGEARRQRRKAASYGRRSVTMFLRRGPSARWDIYESPYLPPFTGTLFQMPDGKQVVQFLIHHPQRSNSDHLYLELEDTSDHYFSAAFEEVVHSSINDKKVVPVGYPRAGRFYCTGVRFRQNVLRDGSGATGWVPVVLVITWRSRNGHAEPLLQLRTELNATREINSLSHLSGHIIQDDYQEAGGVDDASVPAEMDLHHPAPYRAAHRRVQMETGDEPPGQIRALGSYSYLHPDKEHLLFFVYTCEFPGDFQLPRRAEMHYAPIPELLAIRENQALRKAAQLCQAPAMSPRARAAAWEIAALNLRLHDHAGLADTILATARDQPGERVAAQLRQLTEQTGQTWFSGGREVQLIGLAGLQYRNFFSFILPLYAEIGVPGAAGLLSAAERDAGKRAAISRLSELYGDEELMTALPVEL